MSTHSPERLTVIPSEGGEALPSFASEVRRGLSGAAKSLPCRFLYDREGSELFEQICELEEYYPTRAERSILEKRADELVGRFHSPPTLVELGSGSATKTRLVLEACLSHHEHLTFVPIDISESMLRRSALGLLDDYPSLAITAVAAEYHEGLEQVRREIPSPRLLLWLGSSVGNLDREDAALFLARVADIMGEGDRLLLGVDLRKSQEVLESAYDDSQGVTARFNLNLLARINRELGGQFDIEKFAHRAEYRVDPGRIEIHIESLADQRVRIEALDLDVEFFRGERIHTENSYKYDREEIETLAEAAGMELEVMWRDAEDRFSLNLLCAG